MDSDYRIKPLHIVLSKTRAYVKSYDGETKWTYISIEDDELLGKKKIFWSKSIIA